MWLILPFSASLNAVPQVLIGAYRPSCFCWASGEREPNKIFSKGLFSSFYPSVAQPQQTKHQIQSWSTSKLSLPLSPNKTQYHPTVSSSCLWPCIASFIHWLSTAVVVLPPTSITAIFSLLIPFLLSVCGLLLNRRSSTGNQEEHMLMHWERNSKKEKSEAK